MILRKLKFSSLILASFFPILILFTGLFQTNQAFAVSQYVSKLCESTDAGDVSWPTNGVCPKGTTSITPTSLPVTFKALCLAFEVATNQDQIFNAVTTSGKQGCDDYEADTRNFNTVVLITRNQVRGSDPNSTQTNTDPNQTPPIINPTNTTTPVTPKTNPKTTPKTTPKSTTSTSKVNDIGGCPDGFTSKGPLCIPDSPWGSDCDGVACKPSVGELAATIISILLGLSGIIAVIMVIVGGYQVMTARGNESQLKDGKKTLINALIGLGIIIVSYAVVQALTNYLINKN